jgi:hypothetical protein
MSTNNTALRAPSSHQLVAPGRPLSLRPTRPSQCARRSCRPVNSLRSAYGVSMLRMGTCIRACVHIIMRGTASTHSCSPSTVACMTHDHIPSVCAARCPHRVQPAARAARSHARISQVSGTPVPAPAPSRGPAAAGRYISACVTRRGNRVIFCAALVGVLAFAAAAAGWQLC